MILFGQRSQDGLQARLPLQSGEALFRIGRLVHWLTRENRDAALVAHATLQAQVVRDGEGPCAQVRFGLALTQVLIEREEDFLYDLFGIGDGEAQGEQITQEGFPHLVEHPDCGVDGSTHRVQHIP